MLLSLAFRTKIFYDFLCPICVTCSTHPSPRDLVNLIIFGADAIGHAFWGVGLGRLDTGIVVSNPSRDIDVCPCLRCAVRRADRTSKESDQLSQKGSEISHK
jgi:hypothetical protein